MNLYASFDPVFTRCLTTDCGESLDQRGRHDGYCAACREAQAITEAEIMVQIAREDRAIRMKKLSGASGTRRRRT